MEKASETLLDGDKNLALDYELMTAVERYRHGRPTGAEYDAFMDYLLGTELFAEERLVETRALIQRVGRGEYTLDEVRRVS